MIKISVIIPCFNEHNTIVQIVNRILEIKKFDFEIIVIDDFSTDGTREILKNTIKKKIQSLILNEKNYGKGYSIRKGIKRATGDLILIQDADLEYDPNDYEKLINPIINHNADVVFGSRFIGSEEKNVQIMQIRVNFGHPFIQHYFSRINGDKEREGLYRIAIAFVLAERLALNDPVKNRALTVGKIFNQIILNPKF